MRTSIKNIRAMKITLVMRTLFACLVVVALSLAAIPTWAGDAEEDAKQALADWKAAVAAVGEAKKAAKKADEKLGTALANFKSGGITESEEKTLENMRDEKAKADAALEAANERLFAAREALENALQALANDSDLKKELQRQRDGLILENPDARGESRRAKNLSSQTQQIVQATTAGGLHVATFNTENGRVIVSLPDDMRASDTISGTVIAEPKGQTPEERTKNQAELRGYVVAIFNADPQPPKTPPIVTFDVSKGLTQSDGSAKVTETFAAPNKVNLGLFLMPNQNSPTGPCGRSGSIVAINESCSPISQLIFTPTHPSGAVITPDPKITPSFNIPPLGQTGRPIVITGPFDGNASNTTLNGAALRTSVQDFEKNTENVSGGFGLLAESPRKAVFRSPENVVGPIKITLKEGITQTTGTYRNVGVNLSAPKTTLLKGEQTELTVQVSGLEGITRPVPLTLECKGVITMEGGIYQPLVIQLSQVSADGRYTTTRGITGVQAGAWGATATVVTNRFNVCLQDDTAPGRRVLWNTFTGDYIFVCPGCWPPKGQQGGATGTTGESGGTKTGGAKTGGTTETGGTTASPTGGSGSTPDPPGSLTGQGKMIMKGCVITLTHNAPDRRVMSRLDSCTTSGTSTIEDPKTKVKFTITDRNIADNTCQSQ